MHQTSDIRNIAVIGGLDSGKTTLAKAMLFESGVIKRRGTIEARNTVCDYFLVEKEYGYTVFSTLFSAEFANHKPNFIDCAGSDDFVSDIVAALHVTDSALAVVNAKEGVEVGLTDQMRIIEQLHEPVLFIVDQLDSDKADYESTITGLKVRYGGKVIVIQYPVQEGLDFHQVVDVLNTKMYQWKPEGGTPEELEISADQREHAEELHQALIESAAKHEEHLMETFFGKGSLGEEEIAQGMRKGIVLGDMYLVFCASAPKDMGIRHTMASLGDVASRVTESTLPVTTEGVEVVPDATAPVSPYFFKSTVEPHIGEVSYFKVMSGTLKEGMDLTNANNGSKERLGQINVVAGAQKGKVSQLVTGDFGATVKLKDVRRGATLNDKGADYQFPNIGYPAPKYRRAIVSVNDADAGKLSEALTRMQEEDPIWTAQQSKELRQPVMYGQGEFHLRTFKWRLENNDKIPVTFEEPRIPYRKAIMEAARTDYRHKKQSGGAGQFGEVHLIVKPYEEGKEPPSVLHLNNQGFKITPRDTQIVELAWSGKLVFVNNVVGGAIDNRFMPTTLEGIMERMERGSLMGSYARDVRVTIYDGKMHSVDSNKISFILVGRDAFSEASRNAGPKVLGPVYSVNITVSTDYLGDVMSDLQGRRALIMGISSDGNYGQLSAKVPLKEMSGYSTSLSSLMGGRTSFVMKSDAYELVPSDVQETLLETYTGESEEK